VPFLAAECKFNLGQYEDALQIYDKVSRKAKGLERLNALGGMIRCLSSMAKVDKVNELLAEIRTLLPTLNLEDGDRRRWDEWIRLASGKSGTAAVP